MRPMLLAMPGNEELAASLRQALGAEPVTLAMRRFPDAETYLRINSDVNGCAVAVVCTLQDPDARFLPLVFMADTLRELGTRSVGLVAPYLAYMRQDRRFQAGEAITSASFARLLSARFDWLLTVDPHLHRRESLAEIYTIPTEIAQAAPLLAEWIRGQVQDPLVVGPDSESEQWVRAVAEAVPCPHIVLEKTRHGDRDVSVSPLPDLSGLSGRTPVLIDDIVSSARTMIETVKLLRVAGRRAPVCLAVHGLFTAGAYEALREAGAAQIVSTNSVPHTSNAIDLTPILTGPVSRLAAAPATHVRSSGP
ncbi:MAG: ribose-phosphate pyrophosphokinase [Gammaproteobacteria bacterium]|nr:MAG: ribose-phosphate pyrophosphokinase [Gammaproteobacteria bacterium]